MRLLFILLLFLSFPLDSWGQLWSILAKLIFFKFTHSYYSSLFVRLSIPTNFYCLWCFSGQSNLCFWFYCSSTPLWYCQCCLFPSFHRSPPNFPRCNSFLWLGGPSWALWIIEGSTLWTLSSNSSKVRLFDLTSKARRRLLRTPMQLL